MRYQFKAQKAVIGKDFGKISCKKLNKASRQYSQAEAEGNRLIKHKPRKLGNT
jgi:hypothetical protein